MQKIKLYSYIFIAAFIFVHYYFYDLPFSSPNVGQYLSFPSVRCSMHRERMKSRPPTPYTLVSLRDMLERSDMLKDFYKRSIITTSGSIAIILSTNDLIDALSSTTEIYVDGTLSVSKTVFLSLRKL